MKYTEKLSAIQWITHNQNFNEKQHIQLGDAIASFNDCIEQLEEANKLLRTLFPQTLGMVPESVERYFNKYKAQE